jgi:hypothetical protein
VSREGKIGEEGAEAVDPAEILAALTGNHEADAKRRRGAVSCYLSASEGWEKASNLLGGAFAQQDPWLKASKEE